MRYTKKKKVEIINKICKRIVEEKTSIRKILLADDLPNRDTFYTWIKDNSDFADQYARACEDRADAIFDEIIEISDTPLEGKVIETYEDGTTKEKVGDMLGHRRLQIDARKWSLSKMNPKKYGDRQKIEMEVTEIVPIITKRDV